jgi:ribosomal protein S18 acetylase RimI-like enzyme
MVIKENPLVIRKLDPQQKKKASQVVAAAFFNYPMFTFYFPDPQRRTRYLAWYLENVLNCVLRYGEVYTNSEITGMIFTLPPGHTRISNREYVQNGFLFTPILIGFKNFKQSMECEKFVGETQQKLMNNRPHYYLWGLAVDPAHQKEGIGSALLHPVLAKADAQKMPVYLETHDEKNVAYYKKRGFDLIHTARIPKHELSIWCMVRKPA